VSEDTCARIPALSSEVTAGANKGVIVNSNAALMRGLVISGIVSLVSLAGCGGGTASIATPSNPTASNPAPPNASPTITTISPGAALAGGASFTLTINGSNFVAVSIVNFDGAASNTTFVSPTQLTANISADAIYETPRNIDVTVTNPAPGGGASNAVTFRLTSGYTSVAVDPTGKFAYAANGGSDSVSMYVINETTGALTSLGVIAAGTGPASVTVDRFGKFAYVANEGSNDVSLYTINSATGALVPIGTVAAETSPKSVAVDPSSKFAYVANEGSDNVSMYTIDATTAALTSIGTVAAGNYPESIAIDPSGKFVYVVNGYPATASMYTINTTTGALTFVGTIATAASNSGATSIAIDPAGKFAYVTGDGCAFDIFPGNVSMYAINSATGALSSKGSPVAADYCAGSVTVDPFGKFAYVTNYWGDDVSLYTINASTGALTSIGRVAAGRFPTSIAIAPSRRFAYVANSGSDSISIYSIDAATEALTLIGSIGT
jgi:YVTN family beta-propeller protein